ncbi:MAG: ComEA family DNA-binding protein [Methylococcales bacterium]
MPRYISILLALVLFVFAQASRAEPLDINTATAEQFETLVGIGKTKAQAIVSDREKNGSFKSVDDLARVSGIGPATIEKNRSNMIASPEGAAATSTDKPISPAEAN